MRAFVEQRTPRVNRHSASVSDRAFFFSREAVKPMTRIACFRAFRANSFTRANEQCGWTVSSTIRFVRCPAHRFLWLAASSRFLAAAYLLICSPQCAPSAQSNALPIGRFFSFLPLVLRLRPAMDRVNPPAQRHPLLLQPWVEQPGNLPKVEEAQEPNPRVAWRAPEV